MGSSSIPNYVFLGHICHDKKDSSYTLGGTASFGAYWVSALGSKPGIITAYGTNFEFVDEISHFDLINTGSEITTVFENRYVGNSRSQYLLARANALKVDHIPQDWKQTFIIHFAPLSDELSLEMIREFSAAEFKAITPQGLMRTIDQDGKVSTRKLDWKLLKDFDAIIISDEDIESSEMQLPFKQFPLVVLTKNENGAEAYRFGERLFMPSYPSKPNFKTGAGDVFASVFFLKYAESSHIKYAMIYAHCAASIHIENGKLPQKQMLELLMNRVEDYKRMFPGY